MDSLDFDAYRAIITDLADLNDQSHALERKFPATSLPNGHRSALDDELVRFTIHFEATSTPNNILDSLARKSCAL